MIQISTLGGKQLAISFQSKTPPDIVWFKELKLDVEQHSGLIQWNGILNLDETGIDPKIELQNLFLIGTIHCQLDLDNEIGLIAKKRLGIVSETVKD